MNLPNKLTISRIGLTILFMFFLFAHGPLYKVLALFTFLIAAFTDFLDGYIAKRYALTTDFGKFIDPIADKFLTLAAFLAFVEMGLVPAWMVMVIILRELIITSMRLIALRKEYVIAATFAGKHKTVSQMTAIVMILVFIILREFGRLLQFWTPQFQGNFETAILAFMYLTVALTLISGAFFLVKNMDIFRNDGR